jgi:phospholipid/cholesterol/gamma-HCH transport system substrate-binding protein
MGRYSTSDVVTGAIVIAVAAVLFIFAFTLSKGGDFFNYDINARLAKVDGLDIGTDVRLLGVSVGKVSHLDLDPANYLVTVHMSIRDGITIPSDSSLEVASTPFLGGSHLSIVPGKSETMLPSGGTITKAMSSSDFMGDVGKAGLGDINQQPQNH